MAHGNGAAPGVHSMGGRFYEMAADASKKIPAYFVVLDSTYLPAKPKSVEFPVLLFDNKLKLSFEVTAPV